ncbi:MAG: S-adenosylmethionine decarboxylase [Dehalococcoidia bacterium]|nr:S-adenosylmethionine decarboxylase [Dehalococcoidia bacterium]
MHLIIDGYSCNPEILQDEDYLRNWLEAYPSRISMTRISPPYVLKYTGSKLEDWGISGFVFIAESHIAVHTFVERNYINIDVFSCEDFDTDKAIEDFQQGFNLCKSRTCLIDREWPLTEAAASSPLNFISHGK